MVDVNDVKDVASNARIDIDESKAEDFAQEFEEILEVFDKLDDVDTEDVEPAFHPVEVQPELREDVEEDSLDEEQVFSNSENREDGFFKGPSA